MTQADELLPCPFCGSTNLGKNADDGIFWTFCKNCDASGPINTRYSGEEDTPCIDWDSRTPHPDTAAVKAAVEAAFEKAKEQLDRDKGEFNTGYFWAIKDLQQAIATHAKT